MIFVRELKKRLLDETFFETIFWTQIFDFSQSLLYNPEGFFFKRPGSEERTWIEHLRGPNRYPMASDHNSAKCVCLGTTVTQQDVRD